MADWSLYRFRSTPRSVWFALGTGVLGCLTVAGVILFPVLSLIGAAAPFVHIPWVRITVTVIAGSALMLGLLVMCGISRHGAVGWIFAVAAVIALLVVSVFPLVATAFAAVDRVQDVIPFITDLIGQVRSRTGW